MLLRVLLPMVVMTASIITVRLLRDRLSGLAAEGVTGPEQRTSKIFKKV